MGIKKGKQTIIYEIGDAPCRACSVDDMICELETAPTINPQRWIPVDEGLPEERQRCLVTYSGDLVGIAVFTNDLYRFDRYDFMGKKGVSGFVYYDSEYGGYFDFEEVTAWMQLPEPYREEAE